jgi:hypothetical protein
MLQRVRRTASAERAGGGVAVAVAAGTGAIAWGSLSNLLAAVLELPEVVKDVPGCPP